MLYMETILEALSAVRPVTVGATSLIAAMADEIGLADIIDRCCEWDKTRCKISPGKAIEALAICILSDRKALYRVEEFYEGKDVEALFGAGVMAHDFNDDALGRGLDQTIRRGREQGSQRGYLLCARKARHYGGFNSLKRQATGLSSSRGCRLPTVWCLLTWYLEAVHVRSAVYEVQTLMLAEPFGVGG